ncbi:GNAT family N-acetyltransferase [Thalassotalea sp. LPB0316]|nr:GNAT family N-acetyltransferase [Thalassotalea sp. LPB0316]
MTVPNSERLTFTFMTPAHKQQLFDLDQDPEVMKYINGGKVSTWDDIHNRFIPRLQAYANPDKGWGLWMVETLANNEYLGWILVRPTEFFNDEKPTEENNLELGWRFFKKSWGKGYGTEAAMAVMRALQAQNPDVEKFSAMAEIDNNGSINIMKKLGMSYQKTDTYKEVGFDNMEVVYYHTTQSLR